MYQTKTAIAVVAWLAMAALALTPVSHAAGTQDLDKLLSEIEQRYDFPGFSAHFVQESTLAAMDISDQAMGRITVKRPNKMRWEYDTPDPQLIITDGKQLWVYRPDDNQVLVGVAPDFFGAGKGAGFLTDVNKLRQLFDISLEAPDEEGRPVLKLIPKKKSQDLAEVYLTVSPATYEIVRILTINAYGDKTRIDLDEFWWENDISDELFTFAAPPGAEILGLER